MVCTIATAAVNEANFPDTALTPLHLGRGYLVADLRGPSLETQCARFHERSLLCAKVIMHFSVPVTCSMLNLMSQGTAVAALCL